MQYIVMTDHIITRPIWTTRVKAAEYSHKAAVDKKWTWRRECIDIPGKINGDLATMAAWS